MRQRVGNPIKQLSNKETRFGGFFCAFRMAKWFSVLLGILAGATGHVRFSATCYKPIAARQTDC